MSVMNDEKTLTDLINTLEIGTPATVGSLTLVPLLARDRPRTNDPLAYLLYQQAHARHRRRAPRR